MGTKGKKVLIVDGGASSNFPIWLFDRLDATPSWPTFGFLLDERKGQPGLPVPSIGLLYEMAMSVINTGMGAMDKRLSEHDDYRTARRRTLGVNTTAFGLSETDRRSFSRRATTTPLISSNASTGATTWKSSAASRSYWL